MMLKRFCNTSIIGYLAAAAICAICKVLSSESVIVDIIAFDKVIVCFTNPTIMREIITMEILREYPRMKYETDVPIQDINHMFFFDR